MNSKRIRIAREFRGISREEMADRIGVSEWEMWHIEMKGAPVPPDAESKLLFILQFPRHFYDLDDPDMRFQFGSLGWHTNQNEICEVCRNQFADACCDYPVGGGLTCDMHLCDDCRDRRTERIDYCPQHSRLMFPRGGAVSI